MHRPGVLTMVILALTAATLLVRHDDAFAQRRGEFRPSRRRAAVIGNLPREHMRLLVKGREFFYSRGVYYRSGPRGFVAIAGPIGARLRILPAGYLTVRFGGAPYFMYYGTYYQYDPAAREYVVVNPPASSAAPPPPPLDKITLVDGQSIEGTFRGGTDTTVQFDVAGSLKEFPLEQVTSITFAPPSP